MVSGRVLDAKREEGKSRRQISLQDCKNEYRKVKVDER